MGVWAPASFSDDVPCEVRDYYRESGLAAGDVLALALPQRVTLLRMVRVHPHRLGETPKLEELAFEGAEVPSRDALERLAPKLDDPVSLVPPCHRTCDSSHS